MTLGDLVINYRKERNMSQRQFAAYSGLSHAYVSILERNKNPRTGEPVIPTIETIKIVSEAIGISLDEIVRIMDDMPIAVHVDCPNAKSDMFGQLANEYRLDAFERSILSKILRLPPDHRSNLLHAIMAISNELNYLSDVERQAEIDAEYDALMGRDDNESASLDA